MSSALVAIGECNPLQHICMGSSQEKLGLPFGHYSIDGHFPVEMGKTCERMGKKCVRVAAHKLEFVHYVKLLIPGRGIIDKG